MGACQRAFGCESGQRSVEMQNLRKIGDDMLEMDRV